MFNPQTLLELAQRHEKGLGRLAQVEARLNQRFIEFEEPVRALVLSLLSGEPLLLVGPPGTAKSRLIRALCELLGLLDPRNRTQAGEYFEYLLTPFTEPGELFGFYDVGKAMREQRLQRDEEGMMQRARVVYLDEVFNGSSAILNSILTFLNERIFHDRGRRREVAMEVLFASTNEVPQSAELQAVFDRFLLRSHVHNVLARPQPVGRLLEAGWVETYSHHEEAGAFSGLLEEVKALRQDIASATDEGRLRPRREHGYYRHLAQFVEDAREYGLSQISNRRLVKMSYIMLLHRIYEAVSEGGLEESKGLNLRARELSLFYRYFLDFPDAERAKTMQRAAARWNPEGS
ncbi:MAG TPA: AAA family ATPase [Acidobacteriota bacterium]|nr:AAA family ATPase [Acidobacteriota bacterium]